MLKRNVSLLAAMVLLGQTVYAEEIDMSGFDDETPVATQENKTSDDGLLDGFDDSTSASTETSEKETVEESETSFGLTGKLTEQITYALYNDNHMRMSLLSKLLFSLTMNISLRMDGE